MVTVIFAEKYKLMEHKHEKTHRTVSDILFAHRLFKS